MEERRWRRRRSHGFCTLAGASGASVGTHSPTHPLGSAFPAWLCFTLGTACGTPGSPRCFQVGAAVRTERPKSTFSSKGPCAVGASPREGEGAALQGSGQQIFPSQRISQE